KNSDVVIFQHTELISTNIQKLYPDKKHFSWSVDGRGDVVFSIQKIKSHKSTITIHFNNETHKIKIPFIDDVYLHNAFTCISYLLYSGNSVDSIEHMVSRLQPIPMRLELKKGMFNST